jgi:hypothetical protein
MLFGSSLVYLRLVCGLAYCYSYATGIGRRDDAKNRSGDAYGEL